MRTLFILCILASLTFTTCNGQKTASKNRADCPEQTTISMTSTNGAWPRDAAIDWSTIRTVRAFRDESYGVTSHAVFIANFETAAKSPSEFHHLALEKGQAVVAFSLVTQIKGGRQGLPFKAGAYDFTKGQGQVEQTGAVSIRVTGGREVQIDQTSVAGQFTVTHVSPTQLCGRFALKDKWTSLEGAFTAPVVR